MPPRYRFRNILSHNTHRCCSLNEVRIHIIFTASLGWLICSPKPRELGTENVLFLNNSFGNISFFFLGDVLRKYWQADAADGDRMRIRTAFIMQVSCDQECCLCLSILGPGCLDMEVIGSVQAFLISITWTICGLVSKVRILVTSCTILVHHSE